MARFHAALGTKDYQALVLDVPLETYNQLSAGEQSEHTIVAIKIGGAVSFALAKHYAEQIRNQLNQFDAANLAVAKLT